MASTAQALPSPTWPLIGPDGRTITDPWYQAIRVIFARTGGNIGNGITQGAPSPDLTALHDQVTSVNTSVVALSDNLTTLTSNVALVRAAVPEVNLLALTMDEPAPAVSRTFQDSVADLQVWAMTQAEG